MAELAGLRALHLHHNSSVCDSLVLLWEFDGDTWERSDYIPDGAERFTGEITVANALSDWEDLVCRLDARKGPEEHAWFFPLGLGPASKHEGLMMYATNRK